MKLAAADSMGEPASSCGLLPPACILPAPSALLPLLCCPWPPMIEAEAQLSAMQGDPCCCSCCRLWGQVSCGDGKPAATAAGNSSSPSDSSGKAARPLLLLSMSARLGLLMRWPGGCLAPGPALLVELPAAAVLPASTSGDAGSAERARYASVWSQGDGARVPPSCWLLVPPHSSSASCHMARRSACTSRGSGVAQPQLSDAVSGAATAAAA